MDNEYREIRLGKTQALRELGVNPYALRTPERQPCAELIQAYHAANASAADSIVPVPGAVAGRILALRMMGKKVAFLDIWDESGKIQLYINKKDVSELEWQIFENLDLGDWIWALGEVSLTKTGETTLFAKKIELLSKSLAVPPLEKSGGLQDKELRYRKRYMDLLADPERRATFAARSKIVFAIRKFLDERDFMEVETPVMHSIAGGASARPFVTHHNALDMDLFLRVALELPLKRLLVGGYERVYEMGRIFRNEGVDYSHNPEFTMLELYQAFTDYYGMMELVESMLVALIKSVRGEDTDLTSITWDDQKMNFTPPFKRASYGELFKEHVGVDINDEAAVRAKADKIELPKELGHWKLVDELFDEYVQGKLIDPTFVIDYPTVICPLTKEKEDDPTYCERFELFCKGMEFANAFTELNDPVDQLKRFEEQVARGQKEKDEEVPKEVDYDFVEALEYGMPPAGGIGIGIDRLVMMLTDKHSIRDVLLFPHMRREN